MKYIAIVLITFLSNRLIYAQGGVLGNGYTSGVSFPVTTAVPFLSINNDARSCGMGEISVVSNSRNQPNHLLINPSLLAGKGKNVGGGGGYLP